MVAYDGGRANWILRPQPRPETRLRLLCFPYAGGGTSVFRGWAERLPPSVDVVLVRLPGRERRLNEAPFRDMAPLVAALVDALAPLTNVPYAMFGHSLGGLVAFDCAHALRAAGANEPAHLLVSACRAPQLPPTRSPMHDLPTDAFRARLRDLGGTPSGVLEDPDLMDIFEPVLRADFAVAETYRYRERPPLGCPVTAFAGTRDARVTVAEIDPWRAQTSVTFDLRVLPGDHFFLQSEQDMLLHYVATALAPHLAGPAPARP